MTVAALSSVRHAREGREAPAPWRGGSGAIYDACVMDIRKAYVLFCAVPDLIRDLMEFEWPGLRQGDRA